MSNESEKPWRTREEFAKSLTNALREFKPILLGKEKPVSNIEEQIEEWKNWVREAKEDERK